MILNIKVLPIVYVILFGAMMYLSFILFPAYSLAINFSWGVSVAVFALGIVIIGISGIQFRKVSTTVNPLTPEKTSKLVVTGIYRFSRNPMYIGFFLFLVSLGVFLENVVSLIFLPLFILVINRFQILREEKSLEEFFGDEYRQYVKSVRRWI